MNESQELPATLEAMIARLKRHGRFEAKAEYTSDNIQAWETKFSIRFPKSFARVITSGEYDIANFYFVEPFEILQGADQSPEKQSGNAFIAFAHWNEDRFAFRRADLELTGIDNPPVFVLLADEPPLERYQDFTTWFIEIAALADRPVNPE